VKVGDLGVVLSARNNCPIVFEYFFTFEICLKDVLFLIWAFNYSLKIPLGLIGDSLQFLTILKEIEWVYSQKIEFIVK